MTVATVVAALAGAALLVMALPADAKSQPSKAAVAEFKRANPCPATGQAQGACPGYRVDHIVPLCAEGEDVAANLQWQAVADTRENARWTREYCRFHRVRANG